MKATEVTAGLAESNGSLLPGLWRDSLHVTCGLTACAPGSAPGPALGNDYGKTLRLRILQSRCSAVCWRVVAAAMVGDSGNYTCEAGRNNVTVYVDVLCEYSGERKCAREL